MVEVVAFTGALTRRQTPTGRQYCLGDVVDQLSMFTVLPTPAPPNRPTLPPFANGHTRSITLMPVSSRSCEGTIRQTRALRWMDAARLGRPGPSIGRASTSMMRPSVALPTGTGDQRPVAFTIMPRRRPSDEPIAMVRTTPSPQLLLHFQRQAFGKRLFATFILRGVINLGHLSRGNSTSTTAPMH